MKKHTHHGILETTRRNTPMGETDTHRGDNLLVFLLEKYSPRGNSSPPGGIDFSKDIDPRRVGKQITHGSLLEGDGRRWGGQRGAETHLERTTDLAGLLCERVRPLPRGLTVLRCVKRVCTIHHFAICSSLPGKTIFQTENGIRARLERPPRRVVDNTLT